MDNTSTYKYISKKQDILVRRLVADTYHPTYLHMHSHFELLFILTAGDFKIINNGNEFAFKAPALVIHRPLTYHLTDTIGNNAGYSSYTVFFTEQIMKSLPPKIVDVDRIIPSDCMIISLDDAEMLLFEKYLKLLRKAKNPNGKVLLTALLLNEAGEYSDRDNTVHLNSSSYNYIIDIIGKIITDFDRPVSTSDLAEQSHVSVSKLNADFRKMTGTSIKAFITDYRIKRAAEMLLSDDRNITSTAYNCGFCSDSHFIQCFKKQMGMTPGQFIKSNQGDR